VKLLIVDALGLKSEHISQEEERHVLVVEHYKQAATGLMLNLILAK
jgi:hypothetical protein